MKNHRKRRLYFIFILLIGASISVSLVIYALGKNMNLYFTPSQLFAEKSLLKHTTPIRLGGLVKMGSFVRQPNSLKVHFVLTDYQQEVPVEYTGILPTLFREGQGIVVQGRLDKQGILQADQVLAKHDEKYMPPGLEKSGE